MATESFGLFPDNEGKAVEAEFRGINDRLWGRLGSSKGEWTLPENIMDSIDSLPVRTMGSLTKEMLDRGSFAMGFGDLFRVKWHHISLPHLAFIARPTEGSDIWFHNAVESELDLIEKEEGVWALSENLETIASSQLRAIAKVRAAIQAHPRFLGNAQDGVKFEIERLKREHASQGELEQTMVEAKIAAVIWSAFICWWMVIYPSYKLMEKEFVDHMETLWKQLENSSWVGSVFDLVRDKNHGPFTLFAINNVPIYFFWSIAAARDPALARFSPVLIEHFRKIQEEKDETVSWKDLDAKMQRLFPQAPRYDVLLQDLSLKSDLPSGLRELPRQSEIRVIPSIGWKSFTLSNAERIRTGHELIQTRAHRLEVINHTSYRVTIYQSFPLNGVFSPSDLGARELLRNRYAPAWGEVVSVKTGAVEKEGYFAKNPYPIGSIPSHIWDGRQSADVTLTLLGALGGKETLQLIDVDYEMGDGTQEQGSRRKRERSTSQGRARQDLEPETIISEEEGNSIRGKYYSAGESPRRSSSRSRSRAQRSERSSSPNQHNSSSGSRSSRKRHNRKSKGKSRLFEPERGRLADRITDQRKQPLVQRLASPPKGAPSAPRAMYKGPPLAPKAMRPVGYVIEGPGPKFVMEEHRGPLLKGMPFEVSNALAVLANKLILEPTYRVSNPGILRVDPRVIQYGILMVEEPQVLVLLKLLAMVKPRVSSAEELLKEAICRGLPLRIAYQENELVHFRPGPESSRMENIRREKVYYSDGYAEAKLEYGLGGEQLCNQMSSRMITALARPNSASLFHEGGVVAWRAWDCGSSTDKAKILKGPSAQSYEFRAGEKLSGYNITYEYDIIRQGHRNLVLGHMTGSNSQAETWLYPPEPVVKEYLERTNQYFGGQMSPFLVYKLESINKEIEKGMAKTRTKAAWKKFFKFFAADGAGSDLYKATKEDWEYAERLVHRCYPASWSRIALSQLDKQLPEAYRGPI
ncbi:hypothetical protein C8J56DRAFT_1116083 [Mycena floridula]|nr:hypothetical protein C8J56DRAFT_1116083 [Mycena floridula]